jgi:hypothetical protein
MNCCKSEKRASLGVAGVPQVWQSETQHWQEASHSERLFLLRDHPRHRPHSRAEAGIERVKAGKYQYGDNGPRGSLRRGSARGKGRPSSEGSRKLGAPHLGLHFLVLLTK